MAECVHKVAAGILSAGVALDEARMVAVWDEADVLTVRLVRVVKALRLGDLPHLRFAERAERKARVRELRLRERIEDVALVLALVQRFFQKPAPVFAFDAGVVAGHDRAAADQLRAFVKTLELQVAVAVDAGVRRRTALVGGNEAVDDLMSEVAGKVEYIVRNAEPLGHAARVLDV